MLRLFNRLFLALVLIFLNVGIGSAIDKAINDLVETKIPIASQVTDALRGKDINSVVDRNTLGILQQNLRLVKNPELKKALKDLIEHIQTELAKKDFRDAGVSDAQLQLAGGAGRAKLLLGDGSSRGGGVSLQAGNYQASIKMLAESGIKRAKNVLATCGQLQSLIEQYKSLGVDVRDPSERLSALVTAILVTIKDVKRITTNPSQTITQDQADEIRLQMDSIIDQALTEKADILVSLKALAADLTRGGGGGGGASGGVSQADFDELAGRLADLEKETGKVAGESKNMRLRLYLAILHGGVNKDTNVAFTALAKEHKDEFAALETWFNFVEVPPTDAREIDAFLADPGRKLLVAEIQKRVKTATDVLSKLKEDLAKAASLSLPQLRAAQESDKIQWPNLLRGIHEINARFFTAPNKYDVKLRRLLGEPTDSKAGDRFLDFYEIKIMTKDEEAKLKYPDMAVEIDRIAQRKSAGKSKKFQASIKDAVEAEVKLARRTYAMHESQGTVTSALAKGLASFCIIPEIGDVGVDSAVCMQPVWGNQLQPKATTWLLNLFKTLDFAYRLWWDQEPFVASFSTRVPYGVPSDLTALTAAVNGDLKAVIVDMKKCEASIDLMIQAAAKHPGHFLMHNEMEGGLDVPAISVATDTTDWVKNQYLDTAVADLMRAKETATDACSAQLRAIPVKELFYSMMAGYCKNTPADLSALPIKDRQALDFFWLNVSLGFFVQNEASAVKDDLKIKRMLDDILQQLNSPGDQSPAALYELYYNLLSTILINLPGDINSKRALLKTLVELPYLQPEAIIQSESMSEQVVATCKNLHAKALTFGAEPQWWLLDFDQGDEQPRMSAMLAMLGGANQSNLSCLSSRSILFDPVAGGGRYFYEAAKTQLDHHVTSRRSNAAYDPVAAVGDVVDLRVAGDAADYFAKAGAGKKAPAAASGGGGALDKDAIDISLNEFVVKVTTKADWSELDILDVYLAAATTPAPATLKALTTGLKEFSRPNNLLLGIGRDVHDKPSPYAIRTDHQKLNGLLYEGFEYLIARDKVFKDRYALILKGEADSADFAEGALHDIYAFLALHPLAFLAKGHLKFLFDTNKIVAKADAVDRLIAKLNVTADVAMEGMKLAEAVAVAAVKSPAELLIELANQKMTVAGKDVGDSQNPWDISARERKAIHPDLDKQGEWDKVKKKILAAIFQNNTLILTREFSYLAGPAAAVLPPGTLSHEDAAVTQEYYDFLRFAKDRITSSFTMMKKTSSASSDSTYASQARPIVQKCFAVFDHLDMPRESNLLEMQGAVAFATVRNYRAGVDLIQRLARAKREAARLVDEVGQDVTAIKKIKALDKAIEAKIKPLGDRAYALRASAATKGCKAFESIDRGIKELIALHKEVIHGINADAALLKSFNAAKAGVALAAVGGGSGLTRGGGGGAAVVGGGARTSGDTALTQKGNDLHSQALALVTAAQSSFDEARALETKALAAGNTSASALFALVGTAMQAATNNMDKITALMADIKNPAVAATTKTERVREVVNLLALINTSKDKIDINLDKMRTALGIYDKAKAVAIAQVIISKWSTLPEKDIRDGLVQYQTLLPNTAKGNGHKAEIDVLLRGDYGILKNQFPILSGQFLATLP